VNNVRIVNMRTGELIKTFPEGRAGFREAESYLTRINKSTMENHYLEYMSNGRTKRRYGFQLDYSLPVTSSNQGDTVNSIIGGSGSFGGGAPSFDPSLPTNPTPTPTPPDGGNPPTPTPITPTNPGGGPVGGGSVSPPVYVAPTNPPSQNLPLRPYEEAPLVVTGASDNNDANVEAMVESANEDTSYTPLLIGAAGVLGAAGLYLLNDGDDEDKKPKKRKRNRTKEEAQKAFASDFRVIVKTSAQKDLLKLLEIDFARKGPLFMAYSKDKLSLNTSRDGWVIETKAKGFLPYSEENFGMIPGFARLPSDQYYYSTDGSVVMNRDDFSARVKAGLYTKPSKVPGSPGALVFQDQIGRTIYVQPARSDAFIPALNNTIEGYVNRIPYDPKAKAKADDVSIEVKNAMAKVDALKAQRDMQDAGVMTADEYIKSLSATNTTDQRILRQQKLETRQKEEREKRKKALEAAEKEKLEKERAFVQQMNDNLAKEVSDSAVTNTRYSYDKKWVTQYVQSGLGGTISPSSIVSSSYEYSPSGSKLVLQYTPEHAQAIGLPNGFTSQSFSRASMVELGVIPSRYGPSFSPIFVTGMTPTWAKKTQSGDLGGAAKLATANVRDATVGGGGASLSLNAFGAKGPTMGTKTFFKRIPQLYKRNIKQKSFIGANKTLPKNNARLIAHRARQRGLTARTIPAKDGYRVYIGPMRKGG